MREIIILAGLGFLVWKFSQAQAAPGAPQLIQPGMYPGGVLSNRSGGLWLPGPLGYGGSFVYPGEPGYDLAREYNLGNILF